MTKRVHCKREAFDIYIGRGSRWGNPYVFKPSKYTDTTQVASRNAAVDAHMEDLRKLPHDKLVDLLLPLVGKTLGCWCGENERCHGDNYIQLIKEFELEVD